MQRLLLTITFLALLSQLPAQTITWTGDGDGTSWTDDANWSTGAVPTTMDDVLLEDDDITLSGASVTVQRVNVTSSATLTIANNAALNIDGFAGNDDGIDMTSSTSLTNNGIINVSNITGASADGIYARGPFTNNGTITVSSAGRHGILVAGSTFDNAGSITITDVGISDTDGGNDGDHISVDNSGATLSTFNNTGTITITVDVGDHGIIVKDESVANNSGNITIDASGATQGDDGIAVETNGVFNNQAGGFVSVTNASDFSILAKTGTFNNEAGSSITISGGVDTAIALEDEGAFTNAGTITIEGSQNRGVDVRDAASFTNADGGSLSVSNVNDHVIYVNPEGSAPAANFENGGTVVVNGGSNAAAERKGILAELGGLVTNLASGLVTIDGVTGDGIEVQDNSEVSNAGTLSISNTGQDGVELRDDAVFGNSGSVTINAATSDGFEVESGSTFNNQAGGTLTVTNPSSGKDGLQLDGATATINNDGNLVFIGNGSDDIEIKQGTFNNTAGAIFAPGSSPGELEVRTAAGTAFDFGASTINFEIFGTTAVMEYDRVDKPSGSEVVISNTTAFLDWGTFVPAVGDDFTIVRGAGLVTGEFAAITSSNPDIVFDVNYLGGNEVEIEVTGNLPVELTALTLAPSKDGHHLAWSTASETDNERFDVQRSTDANAWATIGSVAGNGTSSSGEAYRFTDAAPAPGMNYYRLKQMDYDGSFALSHIVNSFWNDADQALRLYPNPVTDVLNIRPAAPESVETIRLYNASGALVRQASGAIRQLPTADLPAGVYNLVVQTASSVVTQRVVKR